MLLTLFLKLVMGHIFADFVFQSEFMSAAKNQNKTPYKDVPWWIILLYHSAIHGGIVWFLTGSGLLGYIECVLHFLIDMYRCEGKYSFAIDQLLHISCKLLWAALIWMVYISGLAGDPDVSTNIHTNSNHSKYYSYGYTHNLGVVLLNKN